MTGISLSPFTTAECIIFGANIILWVDFMVSNRNLDFVPSNGESFFHDLMSYTTHAAFCVLFLPFFGLYKLVSRFVYFHTNHTPRHLNHYLYMQINS